MEKVPDWMASIDVQFACNNCPKRQLQNIAFVNLDPTVPAAAKATIDEDMIEDEEEEEEEAAEEA